MIEKRNPIFYTGNYLYNVKEIQSDFGFDSKKMGTEKKNNLK
jgi:hypothetical protein